MIIMDEHFLLGIRALEACKAVISIEVQILHTFDHISFSFKFAFLEHLALILLIS